MVIIEVPLLVVLMVKNLPANASEGDMRDVGSIPGLIRSPGGGHDNPLHYSCLENPMDRGAWRATVHRITKRVIPLLESYMEQLSTRAYMHTNHLCSLSNNFFT